MMFFIFLVFQLQWTFNVVLVSGAQCNDQTFICTCRDRLICPGPTWPPPRRHNVGPIPCAALDIPRCVFMPLPNAPLLTGGDDKAWGASSAHTDSGATLLRAAKAGRRGRLEGAAAEFAPTALLAPAVQPFLPFSSVGS